MLSSFVDHGYVVHAAGPDMSDSTKAQLEQLGCHPEEIHLARTGLNPLKDLVSCWKLYRRLRNLRPEIVFSYTIKPVIYGTLAAWLARVPKRIALITGLGVSFNFRARGLKGLALKLARVLFKTAVRRAHVVIFQNPDDLQLFRDQGFIREQSVGIVNGSGVNLNQFKHEPIPNNPVFLVVARLIVEKGIRDYVAASKLVKEAVPNARFMLAGRLESGPSAISEAELEDWISSGTIEYLGSLDDIRPAFREASVFVLPSYYREGTPRTILEAMAMGRPVITCNTPGCREPIEHEDNGLLVAAQSPRQLADAMIRLGCDATLRDRMGERGRRVAEDRYDVHKVNASIVNLIGLSSVTGESIPR
jgi:glycosyltransferase involved in cell wall biosynthesis